MQILYFEVAAILNILCLHHTLTPEIKLKVLNIDVLLIKVSITDGRRLILHKRSFSCRPSSETSKLAGRPQDIEF